MKFRTSIDELWDELSFALPRLSVRWQRVWAAMGDTEYYAFASKVADQALGRQTDIDSKGYPINKRTHKENHVKIVGHFLRAAAVTTALTLAAIGAHAATINLKADLKASSEVPPKDSAGTGTLTGTLNTDTNDFKYQVNFSGLTGPAVAAHFHGPAAEGANAKPQVPVKGSPVTSPIEGEATLTAEQAKDLMDGKWYFNLHTKANPGGEIRGQVVKAQ